MPWLWKKNYIKSIKDLIYIIPIFKKLVRVIVRNIIIERYKNIKGKIKTITQN